MKGNILLNSLTHSGEKERSYFEQIKGDIILLKWDNIIKGK